MEHFWVIFAIINDQLVRHQYATENEAVEAWWGFDSPIFFDEVYRRTRP